jgi:predicted component of type VI protein secretion system
LHNFRLGDTGKYPLPHPNIIFPVRIVQQFGFKCEPRASWTEITNNQVPILEWGDFGILSPLGPLPDHYSERALFAGKLSSVRFQQFIASITQRLSHLYYRSWSHLRPECELYRNDDRFSDLLSVFSGSKNPCIPYFAWQRPNLRQLPFLAKSHCGVKIRLDRKPISAVENTEKLEIGKVRLGKGRLGHRVFLFNPKKICIWIEFYNFKQFIEWRHKDNEQRKYFESLVQDCLELGVSYEIRFITPPDAERGIISRGRLGQTCLTKGSATNEY